MNAQTGQDCFAYEPPAPGDFRVRALGIRGNCALYEVSFPSPLRTVFPETNKVRARYYRPQRADRAVVVLHGILSEFSARYCAYALAKRGIATFQITLNYGRKRRPRRVRGSASVLDYAEVFRIGFRQAVLDTRCGADFLCKEYERIGIVGVSLGAIIASLVTAIDDRFKTAVYVLGGAGIADIMFDSRDIIVRHFRRRIRGRVSREALARQWQLIEPLEYAKPGKQVLMMNAKYDTVIPMRATEKLWLALGKPPIQWLTTTHTSIYTHIFYLLRETVRHFRSTL